MALRRPRHFFLRFLLTAALLAAVLVFIIGPPAPLTVPAAEAPAAPAPVLRGAYHIHTTQSDGALDRDRVAEAASRAGLQFAIFTDHGDGTRPPEPPEYVNGVLCLEGVEVSTNQGHYVALGAAQSPYRLGGDAEAVAEDIARLGGFGIVAHPFSPRRELAWTDWTVAFDGLEWLNADSEWRDEGRGALTRALLGYLWRPGGALASLLDHPDAALAKWDAVAGSRRVVGLAAHDAHGGFGEEDGSRGRRWHLPSYEASFRTFSLTAQLRSAPTGQAAADAALLIESIRSGRVFTAIDAIASPAVLDFTANAGGAGVTAGGVLPDTSEEARFVVRAPLPREASIVLLRNGEVVQQGNGNTLEYSSRERGAFRVEIRVPGAPGTPPIPWVVSNPIFRFAAAAEPLATTALPASQTVIAAPAWRVEKSGEAGGALTASDGAGRLDYRIGTDASPFAALVVDLPQPGEAFSAVVFRGRASKPMRMSTQLRFAPDNGARWRKSVYLDSRESEFVVPISGFRPADRPGPIPVTSRATSLLFVVDSTNAAPGEEGSFTISNVALRR